MPTPDQNVLLLSKAFISLSRDGVSSIESVPHAAHRPVPNAPAHATPQSHHPALPIAPRWRAGMFPRELLSFLCFVRSVGRRHCFHAESSTSHPPAVA